MPNRFSATILALLAGLTVSVLALAQAERPPQPGAVTDQQAASAPAPRHDISGTWEPANGPGDGIQQDGVKAMPNDGTPEHELPYTPLGLATYKSHRPLEGPDAVLPAMHNDPRNLCEPIGFPRANHYNLRQTQILQNEFKVVVLYEYAQTWRVIWTDGREVATEIPEPQILRVLGWQVGGRHDARRRHGRHDAGGQSLARFHRSPDQRRVARGGTVAPREPRPPGAQCHD